MGDVGFVDDKDVTKWRFYRRGSIPSEWLVSMSTGYDFPGDDTGEPRTQVRGFGVRCVSPSCF